MIVRRRDFGAIDPLEELIPNEWARVNKDGLGKYDDFLALFKQARDISDQVDALPTGEAVEYDRLKQDEAALRTRLLVELADVKKFFEWDERNKPNGLYYLNRAIERTQDVVIEYVSLKAQVESVQAVIAHRLELQAKDAALSKKEAADATAAASAKAEADRQWWAAKHAADTQKATAATQSKLDAAKTSLSVAKATGDTTAIAQAKALIESLGGELSILDKYTVAGYPAVVVIPIGLTVLVVLGAVTSAALKKSPRGTAVAGYRLRRSRR